MPKRRKESEEEYYIRAAAEAKEAKKALAKKSVRIVMNLSIRLVSCSLISVV